MNKIIITSILFLLISGLTGCATKSKEEVFQSTLREYERVIRWGDITKANQFRKEPVLFSSAEKKKFKIIKVTGYNPQKVTRRDDSTVMITVELRYYNEQFMREKTIDDYQQWDYDATKNLWFISSPLPEF